MTQTYLLDYPYLQTQHSAASRIICSEDANY